MGTLFISADCGNGNTKIVAQYEGKLQVYEAFPTVYCEVDISQSLVSSMRVSYVTFKGVHYTFGEEALAYTGNPRPILFNERYESEILTRVYPMWIAGRVMEWFAEFDPAIDQVVYSTFVPPYVYNSKIDELDAAIGVAKRVYNSLSNMNYNGKKIRLQFPDLQFGKTVRPAVIVMPEALAAAQMYIRNADGQLNQHAKTGGVWLVVDIGSFTTDWAELYNHEWRRVDGNFASEPNSGIIKRVLQPLKQDLESDRSKPFAGNISINDVERATVSGMLQIGKNKYDISEQLKYYANTYWDYLRRSIIQYYLGDLVGYHQVLFVGGGADFIRKWGGLDNGLTLMGRDYGSLVVGHDLQTSHANAIGGLYYAKSKLNGK